MSLQANPHPMARAPKGKGVIWMRRIANIGFGIAALYFVYLVAILLIAARNNSEFEGQLLGPIEVEYLNAGQLTAANLWSEATSKKQVVVLWATWCGPCHSLLMDLKDEIAEGRLRAEDFLAVSIAEPLTDVSAYLQKTPLPFRVALDREGVLARRLKLSGTPTVVFLDEGGVIRNVSTGGFGLTRKVADFLKSGP